MSPAVKMADLNINMLCGEYKIRQVEKDYSLTITKTVSQLVEFGAQQDVFKNVSGCWARSSGDAKDAFATSNIRAFFVFHVKRCPAYIRIPPKQEP